MQILLTLFWGAAVAGSRILYFSMRKQSVADTYGYFANAMIRSGNNAEPFHSGIAGIYSQMLSGLLRFTGNRIEAVCVYQMVLQIIWLLLMCIGISMVFGKLAGIALTTIMSAMPIVLQSILTVSPGNFYMLLLSLLLVVSGVIFMKVRVDGSRKIGKSEEKTGEILKEEKKAAMEENQDGYIITEDGRKIKLLDNPLPVPKKHISKKIDFDFDDVEVKDNKMDFDIEISDKDDFDI